MRASPSSLSYLSRSRTPLRLEGTGLLATHSGQKLARAVPWLYTSGCCSMRYTLVVVWVSCVCCAAWWRVLRARSDVARHVSMCRVTVNKPS